MSLVSADALGYPYADVRSQVISRLPLIDAPGGSGLSLFVQIAPARSSRCRTCISRPVPTARPWSGAERSVRRSSRSNGASASPRWSLPSPR